eukprot:SM000113S24068  [mRNA]  locus=s113:205538:206131:- [translate_table: standard]
MHVCRHSQSTCLSLVLMATMSVSLHVSERLVTSWCLPVAERPRFCRVEPEVFKDLYDVDEQDMDATACNFCMQSIRDVYGGRSKELKSFRRIIRTLGR